MKGKKPTTPPPAPPDSLTFEQAIAQLEKIVAEMEAAELPLDEVLRRYEQGTRLVRFCGRKLEEAEKKIELLTKNADGSIELEPFGSAAAEPEQEREQETGDEDEGEGKLF